MKHRSGFVSNSSSSSFIVIGSTVDDDVVEKLRHKYGERDVLAITPDLGCHEFGWENTKYSTFWDAVMFSFMQAEYVQEEHPEWMQMLNRVLKRELAVKHIVWGITTKWGNSAPKETLRGYIDHQSASSEGTNTEMFKSEDALTNFLFSDDSYIQGGNDNE